MEKVMNRIGDLLDRNEIFLAEDMVNNLENEGLTEQEMNDVRESLRRGLNFTENQMD